MNGLGVESLDIIERGSLTLLDEDHIRAVLEAGPELEARQYFNVRVKSGRYTITAGKYLGVIPIGANLVLRVRPKVPTSRLVDLLGIARESPLFIQLMERHYAPGQDVDVLEMLLLALHRSLRPLFQHGPIREYRLVDETGQTIRGTPDFGAMVSRLWPQAAFDRAAYSFYEFGSDNELNQAIECTLWHAIRVLPQLSPTVNVQLLRDLDDAHRMFAGVEPDRTRSFLPSLRRHLAQRVTDEPYASFRPILSLCLMILDDLGVDFDADPGDPISLTPMVIDMESVFERFLVNVITDQAASVPGLTCWDTARDQQIPLFGDPSLPVPPEFLAIRSREPAKPDFTIALNGVPVLIGDAKYKTQQHVDDVYQVVAHAAAYGAKDVLLVYPATELSDTVTFSTLGSVGDVRVFICAFPLDADDLAAASRELFSGIERIVGSRYPGFLGTTPSNFASAN